MPEPQSYTRRRLESLGTRLTRLHAEADTLTVRARAGAPDDGLEENIREFLGDLEYLSIEIPSVLREFEFVFNKGLPEGILD